MSAECGTVASLSCPDCGLLICAVCDATMHIPLKFQVHVRTAWPPAGPVDMPSHAGALSHPADQPPQLIPPDLVTDYVRIDGGQSGVVFRALYQSFLVVVKVPHPLATDTNTQLKEYNILAGFKRHPNLLALIGGIMANDQVHLVLPYMPGGSLAKRMQTEPLWDSTRATEAAIDMFDGLAALHDQGIVHRDCAYSLCLMFRIRLCPSRAFVCV